MSRWASTCVYKGTTRRRLRGQFADLADEDVDFAEGDPIPVLDSAGLGAPACIVDVELATTTLSHPAHSVSLDPFKAAL